MREGLMDDTGYDGLECDRFDECCEEEYLRGIADGIDELLDLLYFNPDMDTVRRDKLAQLADLVKNRTA